MASGIGRDIVYAALDRATGAVNEANRLIVELQGIRGEIGDLIDGFRAGAPDDLNSFVEVLDRFREADRTLGQLSRLLEDKANRSEVAESVSEAMRAFIAAGTLASIEQVAAAALTQTTQELAGPPTDLPIGKQRLVWNTKNNAPSFWMNRGGTIIDAFDPGTF